LLALGLRSAADRVQRHIARRRA